MAIASTSAQIDFLFNSIKIKSLQIYINAGHLPDKKTTAVVQWFVIYLISGINYFFASLSTAGW